MSYRILFLLTQDLQSPSGLGRYMPLASELVRKGHEVRVAALHSNFENLEKQEQEVNGVSVHYVAPMHVKKSGSEKHYYSTPMLLVLTIYSAWQLFKAALAFPADIVLICKPHPMNTIAAVLARILRPRIQLILDCDDYEAASNRFSGSWQRHIVEFFENRAPFWVDRVISNTYFSLNRMRALGVSEGRLGYVPNGVDRARFSQTDHERVEALRAEWNLDGKSLIVYVGSLSLPSHPVDLLIQAFALLQKRIPNSRLLIVGGGEDLQVLQEQVRELGVAEQVIFTGRVPPNTVSTYYAMGNVSVDPVYDTPAAAGRAPLKMFESWAVGVPFVTVDVGDRRLLAGDPPAALLAQPGSADSLAKVIEHVICQPEMAKTLVCNGLQRIEKYYWDQIVERSEWVNTYKTG